LTSAFSQSIKQVLYLATPDALRGRIVGLS
jgi:hypothetical protein